MGLFAQWQPAYAEAGIATFPVDLAQKKPMVGNPLKAGRPASAEWAAKFPEVNALGFACGKYNRLTVVDIDEPGDGLVADVMARLGPTPIVVGTASGKRHLWYRHNGEPRSPRRLARQMGLPGEIDILGERGFAVAPPSRGAAGAYEWLEGSLADVSSLPVMRSLGISNDNRQVASVQPPEVEEGGRNVALLTACGRAAPACRSLQALTEFALALNQSGQWSALPVAEVHRTAASAWKYQVEGTNGFAGDRFVQLTHSVLDVLEADPDGHYLFTFLKRKHWGRDFALANELRNHLPCGVWSLPRFRAAREFLARHGLIWQVRPAIKGVGPAVFRFSPLDVPHGGTEGRGV